MARADPQVLPARGFFPLRGSMVQATGVLAMGCMSVAMMLAAAPALAGAVAWRPRQDVPPAQVAGHRRRWSSAIVHWLLAQGPKWAVGWAGWSGRRAARTRRAGDPVAAVPAAASAAGRGPRRMGLLRGRAADRAGAGPRVPLPAFYKTHRLLAVGLPGAGVPHRRAACSFGYWASPLGVVMALLLACGTLRRGRRAAAPGRRRARRVDGRIAALTATRRARDRGGDRPARAAGPGTQAGQFAFVTADARRGSAPLHHRLGLERGRPAHHLHRQGARRLHPHAARDAAGGPGGQRSRGRTAASPSTTTAPRQIWVGGGIGITPFIARMKHLADCAGERRSAARPGDRPVPHHRRLRRRRPSAS